jgi:hypothetical protein
MCRIAQDICEEGSRVAKTLPLVAAPLKGPLFDFLELDVEMTLNSPASAALEHLAQCILQPNWLPSGPRNSGVSLFCFNATALSSILQGIVFPMPASAARMSITAVVAHVTLLFASFSTLVCL